MTDGSGTFSLSDATGSFSTSAYTVTMDYHASNNLHSMTCSELMDISAAMTDKTYDEQTVNSFTHSAYTLFITGCYASTTIQYEAELVGGAALPTWLTYDPLTRTFTTLATSVPGVYNIQLKAYVQTDSIDTEVTFLLTINNVNEAPSFVDPFIDDSVEAIIGTGSQVITYTDVEVTDTHTLVCR